MTDDVKKEFVFGMPGEHLSSIRMSIGDDIQLEVVPEDVSALLKVLNERDRVGTFTMRLRKPYIGSGKFDGVKTEHLMVDVEHRIIRFNIITDTPRQFTFKRGEVTLYLRELNKLIQKEQ